MSSRDDWMGLARNKLREARTRLDEVEVGIESGTDSEAAQVARNAAVCCQAAAYWIDPAMRVRR